MSNLVRWATCIALGTALGVWGALTAIAASFRDYAIRSVTNLDVPLQWLCGMPVPIFPASILAILGGTAVWEKFVRPEHASRLRAILIPLCGLAVFWGMVTLVSIRAALGPPP